jgi:hypothetical protein
MAIAAEINPNFLQRLTPHGDFESSFLAETFAKVLLSAICKRRCEWRREKRLEIAAIY